MMTKVVDESEQHRRRRVEDSIHDISTIAIILAGALLDESHKPHDGNVVAGGERRCSSGALVRAVG